jgi:hypothetical protein
MNVEGTDCSLGLDIVSELIVSRCGFNPDDIFVVRACPGCGRQPAEVITMDIAGSGRFAVTVKGSFQGPVELPGNELLYCKCNGCGSIYCVVMFGPVNYERAVITEYLIVREDRFLKIAIRELEALMHEGKKPGNVDDWITLKLAESINKALAGMDSQLCLTDEDRNESLYRKKWFL